MNKSETIGKLAAALAKAQGEMDDAAKDSTNPAFRSKYANLAAVRAAIRQPLSSNGLAYTQLPRFDGDMVHVETVLMHAESGEFISGEMSVPVIKKDAHGVGSATTYARRFSLMAVLGIAPDEDDDGNAASQPAVAQRKAPPPRDDALRARLAQQEPPIDEIPHAQPKEAPNATNAEPTPAAASVPAARRVADMIPEVPPTQHPVPGVGQFKGKAPVDPVQSGMTAQLLIGWLTKRTNELKRDANKAKAVSSAYENWKLEARAQWDELVDVDKRRVKQARESLEAALVAAKPAPVPAHDPSTGEILEAD